jgi:formylglycine-generating enzyme required for sulfatase activity
MAAAYCNWLSETENIPPNQWGYREESKGRMKPYPDYLSRTGYRLPTEAEWEYACRAETTSICYFGSSPELLGRYSWHLANSLEQPWPVGQKRPNDLGLFDMHGNVWNYCQDSVFPYPAGRVEDKEKMRKGFQGNHILRGTSFVIPASHARSANCFGINPGLQSNFAGVRPCRTYP